jgi:hypothetical protein
VNQFKWVSKPTNWSVLLTKMYSSNSEKLGTPLLGNLE